MNFLLYFLYVICKLKIVKKLKIIIKRLKKLENIFCILMHCNFTHVLNFRILKIRKLVLD